MAMARLALPLRRGLISSFKYLTPKTPNPGNLRSPISIFTSRSYISEMRKSAFEGNILRLLRNEIQYEIDQFAPKQVPLLFSFLRILLACLEDSAICYFLDIKSKNHGKQNMGLIRGRNLII